MWTPRWHKWPNGPFTLNKDSPQARGLVAWWPSAASNGSRILRDLFLRNYKTGVLVAGTSWSQSALCMTADTHGASVTRDALIEPQRLTLAVWAQSSGPGNYKGLIQKTYQDGWASSYKLGTYEKGAYFEIYESGFNRRTAESDLTWMTGVWNLLVGTYDGSYARLYVNGVLTATSDACTGTLLYLTERNLTIGNDNGALAFLGMIFDTRLYDRGLSADEVWQLYDPATRWDLYLPEHRVWLVSGAATHDIVDAGDIVSEEVEGQPVISTGIVGAGNIPSVEVEGQPTVSASVIGIGNIASEEVEGQPVISIGIVGAGDVSSEEAEGQPIISGGIVDAGNIASDEVEGQPTISSSVVGAGGIASSEAHGQPDVSLSIIGAGGITSTEAFGLATITVTGDITGVGGIISVEAEGQPVISAVVGGAGGIPSAEVVEQPTVIAVIIGAGGIPSGEVFGNPSLYTTITGAGNIPSAETFGNPVLIWNGEIIGAGGIPSGEAFGNPVLTWTAIPTPVPPASAAYQSMSPKWGWEPAPIREYPWMRRILEPGVDDDEEELILLVHEMHKKGSI